ncbi:MAG: ATP-binding cassette domain-containing protein [Wolinella succinogenes]|uniref:ABC transporter ATP-binding protein n=1 Tax=Wolinella succinogenes TaxID=844 RepID=UPI0016BC954B|nr:ATP-binding cassette domain-containing protein [Wolinella succinogenes]NLU34101.1 ATP-binding cassette domain-containing protein [Wolinella succinogenes]
MPLLSASSLGHAFEHELFGEVSLEADSGECVSIMGVSGSGKSTLLHALSTLLKPLAGEVKLFDQSIYQLPTAQLLELRREKLGIIFQSHYLFRGFSGIENLQVASILSKQPLDYELLEAFGIAQVVEQSVGELSGGQQQRLSIARVLTKKPQIIFADEPTGNLDQETASSVMEALFDYVKSQKALLLFATHDASLAKRCDRIYRLDNKRLLPWSF